MKRIAIIYLLVLCGWLWGNSDAIAAEERLIAVIMANSQQRHQAIYDAFAAKSQPFCNDNCKIYIQKPNADKMSLRNSVRKAVALDADLIITFGPSASLAAQTEAPPIPTLFADVYEPVNLGIVSARSMTGRNMTGIRADAPIQSLFKYFTEATRAKKIALLYDRNSSEGVLQKTVLEESAKKKGIALIPLAVDHLQDRIPALKTLPPDIDGLFLACNDFGIDHLIPIFEYAATRRLPVMTQHVGAAEAGAFMVLETSAVEQGEKLAEFAEQLLAGAKTEDLPMYTPRQVAFVVNLKVARLYGIQVPLQTLSVASRVVR